MNIIPDNLQFAIRAGFKSGATAAHNSLPSVGVVILPGHFDTLGIDNNNEIHRHSPAAMAAAGLRSANAILDDNTVAENADNGVMPYVLGQKVTVDERIQFIPGSPDIPLRGCLEVLRTNPRYVRCISIETNDTGMFNGNFTFGEHNPFARLATRDLRLSQFKGVNQFDQTKIVVNYAIGHLPFHEDIFFAINGIPMPKVLTDTTDINVNIEFYSLEEQDAYEKQQAAARK